jgi:hypothetical protein
MNNVLLGAIDVATSPDQAQTTTYAFADQTNADGTYNISLPQNAQGGGNVVAKDTDVPTGEDPGTDDPGTDDPGAEGNMKKMLPVLIIGGLALIWFLKKRKK